MFNRLSQLGKSLADELENAVKPATEPNSNTSSRPNTPSGPKTRQPRGSDGEPTSINSKKAFDTLRANASLLNTQTPDPGSLDVTSEPHEDVKASATPESADTSNGNAKETGDDTTNGTADSAETEPASEEPTDKNPASNKPDEDSTVQPVSGKTVVIDGFTVPKEIGPKLRKFKKYEAKYPSKWDLYELFY